MAAMAASNQQRWSLQTKMSNSLFNTSHEGLFFIWHLGQLMVILLDSLSWIQVLNHILIIIIIIIFKYKIEFLL